MRSLTFWVLAMLKYSVSVCSSSLAYTLLKVSTM